MPAMSSALVGSQARLAVLFMAINNAVGKAIVTETDYTTVPCSESTTIYEETCTANVTVFDTKTVIVPTTIRETHFQDVFVNTTETSTVVECVTESKTTTLYYTVSLTETETDTDEVTVTTTDTVPATVTTTDTVPATVTTTNTVPTTVTTTDTVPATVTTYTTKTIVSTSYDPCPTTCSISAGTVNLYFWPTDRPYSYPSTYVDTKLDYTFISPSVYILLPTAQGTNSLGRVGPSTSKWIIPLRLDEVSTIVGGTLTRQLTLNDIGTDCAQTADPTAIATLVDSRCDPILAAPKVVSSWAYPCNACGRFGLFDPPYAVPTVTGGLIDPTTATQVEATVTEVIPTATAVVSDPASSIQDPASSIQDPASSIQDPASSKQDPTTDVVVSSVPPPTYTAPIASAPTYTAPVESVPTDSASTESAPVYSPPSPPASTAATQGSVSSAIGTEPTLGSSSGSAQLPSTGSSGEESTGLSTSPTTVPTASAPKITSSMSWILASVLSIILYI